MKNYMYKDQQNFTDKLVFLLLAIGLFGGLVGLFYSIWNAHIPIETTMAYLTIAIVSLVWIVWLRMLELKVSINDKRIKFKLYPIHRRSQKIFWDDVESCEIVTSPVGAQWHGSNLQYAREALYSLTGRNGLRILLADGRRYFIGCKDVDLLQKTLSEVQSLR